MKIIIFAQIVLLFLLLAGCLKPNYQKSCQDFNGFSCEEGFVCKEGYYEVTDNTNCCAKQCLDSNSSQILVEKSFAWQGNAKCEILVDEIKATILFKGEKFNIDFNDSKLRADENYFYSFIPQLNGWVMNDKTSENILWEKVKDYASTFPEKAFCSPEEFSDDLFTVSETELIQPQIE